MIRPLSYRDVEAELSYAYLHAVTSAAQMSVLPGSRVQDNNGIDASLTAWHPYLLNEDEDAERVFLTEIDLKIQLKATIEPLPLIDGRYSYFFRGAAQYNDMARGRRAAPRILVVLQLPTEPVDWLEVVPEHLRIRHRAHWVSLMGGNVCTNLSGETVYLPEDQLFSPAALRWLAYEIACRRIPSYAG